MEKAKIIKNGNVNLEPVDNSDEEQKLIAAIKNMRLMPIVSSANSPTAYFVKPVIEQAYIPHFGITKNYPVNINLCTELVRYDVPTLDYSTDSEEAKEIIYPVIEFKGCNAKWYFEAGDVKTRDEQYEALFSINKPIILSK